MNQQKLVAILVTGAKHRKKNECDKTGTSGLGFNQWTCVCPRACVRVICQELHFSNIGS